MAEKVKLLICGGGNGAHVMAGLAAHAEGTEASVLTLFSDEAEKWTKAMETDGFTITRKKAGKDLEDIKAMPKQVVKDPKVACEGVNLIVMVVPAFGHVEYLDKLKPYIAKGTTIVGMPGQAGFEFDVRGVLGPDLGKELTIMNFESLPWACRIEPDGYGKRAAILGTKARLAGAICLGKNAPTIKDPLAALQRVMGDEPKLQCKGHLLGMTLMACNAYLHPGILYGKWSDYTSEEFKEAPLFYEEITELGATTLDNLSKEVVSMGKKIQTDGGVDLSTVTHITEWFERAYGTEITDKTNLKSKISTNEAYKGLKHPMTEKVKGKPDALVPDFKNRYFTEDCPYGLVVLRGIAEVAGVATPTMDKVILWMQSKLEKEFLKQEGKGKDYKLTGKDIQMSRCPQKYSLTTLNAILGK